LVERSRLVRDWSESTRWSGASETGPKLKPSLIGDGLGGFAGAFRLIRNRLKPL
jgi:hypothetical protein